MRSEWTNDENIGHILAALTKENRLAIMVSLETGLRIGDVLRLPSAALGKEKFTIFEEKTRKRRVVRVSKGLREQLFEIAGRWWMFEGRTTPVNHRTRQAVYKDVRRAAKAFRLTEHISPHSARKVYAVHHYEASGHDMARVRELLNHSDEAVTAIYALADALTLDKHKRR